MRNAILDIFKALRHFGVSADEVESVAEAYKFWVEHQIDFVPFYNHVYCYKGTLYAVPYPIKKLEYAFIGIELDGVVYLAKYQCNIGQNRISESLRRLKKKVFYKISDSQYGVEIPDSLEPELPTGNEIKNLIEKTQKDKHLDCVVFNNYSHFWVKHDSVKQGRAVAVVTWRDEVEYLSPTPNIEAHLQPVIRLRKGTDFIGHINNFGAPDKETVKVYERLLANT